MRKANTKANAPATAPTATGLVHCSRSRMRTTSGSSAKARSTPTPTAVSPDGMLRSSPRRISETNKPAAIHAPLCHPSTIVAAARSSGIACSSASATSTLILTSVSDAVPAEAGASSPAPPRLDLGTLLTYGVVEASGRTVRLAVGPAAVAVVLIGIAAGTLAFGIVTAARRTIGWAVACVVVAAVIEPVVARLDRHIPRALATLVTFLAIGAGVGLVLMGVFRDLDTQIERLQEAVPASAAELEAGDGFLSDLARDLNLAQRAEDAVAELDEPSSGVAVGVASSAGTYFVCAILTIFFLSWGPRLGAAALQQIEDPDQQRRVGRLTRSAFSRGRTYILAAIGLGLAAGAVAWGLFEWEDAPAPMALAVAVAAGSVIPGIGIIVGGLPAILLETGLGSPWEGARLLIALVVLQAVHLFLLRRYVAPSTVQPGPAIIVITMVLGYEIYGAGGAFYGAALMVFVVAGLDAIGRSKAQTTT